jgi:hypothetical protein
LCGSVDTSNFPEYEELPLLQSERDLYCSEFEDFWHERADFTK